MLLFLLPPFFFPPLSSLISSLLSYFALLDMMIKILMVEPFRDTAEGGEGTDQHNSVIIIGVTQINLFIFSTVTDMGNYIPFS